MVLSRGVLALLAAVAVLALVLGVAWAASQTDDDGAAGAQAGAAGGATAQHPDGIRAPAADVAAPSSAPSYVSIESAGRSQTGY